MLYSKADIIDVIDRIDRIVDVIYLILRILVANEESIEDHGIFNERITFIFKTLQSYKQSILGKNDYLKLLNMLL